MMQIKKYVAIIKKIWSNKKYRALLILILYFMFNFAIISSYKTRQNHYEKYQEQQNDLVKEKYIQEIKISLDNRYLIVDNEKEINENKYVVMYDEVFGMPQYTYLTNNDDNWLKYIFRLKDTDIDNYLASAIKNDEINYTSSFKKNSYVLNLQNIVDVQNDCNILIDEYIDDKIRIKIDADISNCRDYIDSTIGEITLTIENKLKN